MARIRDFIDSNGLVCSRHISGFDEIGREITSRFPWLDGGDSANRTMAFYIGVQLVYKHGLSYLCNWRDIFGFIKRKYILLGSKIFGSKEKINNATYDLRHKTC